LTVDLTEAWLEDFEDRDFEQERKERTKKKKEERAVIG
jgi:hypothetical protein